jgi:hypothetical protein
MRLVLIDVGKMPSADTATMAGQPNTSIKLCIFSIGYARVNSQLCKDVKEWLSIPQTRQKYPQSNPTY